MNNYQKHKKEIVDYFYTLEDYYIKTYGIIKKDDTFYKIFLDQFNYYMYGERLIEKLRGRNYLSKEECIEKYHLELEELKEVKTKRNSLFRKRK